PPPPPPLIPIPSLSSRVVVMNLSRESLSAEPVDEITMQTHIPWSEVADVETRLLEILYRAGKPNVRSLRIKFTRRRRGLDVLFSFALCEDCTALSGTDQEIQCDLLPSGGATPFTYSMKFLPSDRMNRMENSIQVGES
ncbi:hypothetical protein PMAYCL1PPCAC_03513, partial [Pristionchus mayeri]